MIVVAIADEGPELDEDSMGHGVIEQVCGLLNGLP